jgi:hypothetical protein
LIGVSFSVSEGFGILIEYSYFICGFKFRLLLTYKSKSSSLVGSGDEDVDES